MFRIVDRGGAVVAAAAAVVCLATLSWIATGGSSARYDRPVSTYPGSGDSPSLSAPSTTSVDGSPAAAAPQPSSRTEGLGGGAVTPRATAPGAGRPAVPAAGTPSGSPSGSPSGTPSASVSDGPEVPPSVGPDGSPSPSGSAPQSPWSPARPSAPASASASASDGPAPHLSAPPSPSGSGAPEPEPSPSDAGSPPPSAAGTRSHATPSYAARGTGTGAGGPATSPGAPHGCPGVTPPIADAATAPVRPGRIVITMDVVDPRGPVWSHYSAHQPLPVPLAPGVRTVTGHDVCAPARRVAPGAHEDVTGVTPHG